MFNDNVSRKFKRAYFVSSFLLSYLFLIIIMYAQYVETNGKFFPDFQILVTTKKGSLHYSNYIIFVLIKFIILCKA